jgi:hypothetical protein
MALEQELQCHLNDPWPYILLDLPEVRRTDIADGQAEIRMIQEIEQLPAELKFLRLGYTKNS